MSRSFVAWLLVTVGLALLSVSVVLVPNNAFADDGSGCDGRCVYTSDFSGTIWQLTSSTCAISCPCPYTPNIPPPTGPGQQKATDCSGLVICVFDCSCPTVGQPCAGATGCTTCTCIDGLFGPYCG